MLKTIFGFVSSAGSALIPGIGPALKFGPYIAIALLAGLALLQHSEINTARAQTALANSKIVLAVTTCQQEAASEAAKENAVAAAQIAAAQAKANAATAALMASRSAMQAAQAQAASALASSMAEVDADAVKPGEDGPIPPVVAGVFP